MTLSLVIVTFAIFATPMILSNYKISVIPTSVAEVIVGIILGKSFLNIVHMDNVLNYLSTLGVIFLMFLSGMEIDFSLFKKNSKSQMTPLEIKQENEKPKTSPLKTAILAYGFTVVTAVVLAILFKVSGLFSNFMLATILFATVSLGVVISLLKEKELLSTPFGQTLLLFAVLGEVVPLLALTVYSSIYSGKGETLWLISLIFIVAAIFFRRFRKFFTFFDKINKATTQLDVRLAFLIIITLVVLSEKVGAENILGAFVAGIVVKLLQPAKETQRKLDSIGYGIFIPFFFVITGVKLNIPSLLTSPDTVILIPLFFLAFMLVKVPAYFGFKTSFSKRNSRAGVMLSSTTITLVLATLAVAEQLKAITSQQSGAFILAGILTCIFGPMLFNRMYKPEPEDVRKTTVSIIGANFLTVPAAQQVAKDWYDVTIYTDKETDYTTYKSRANVKLVDSLNPKALIKNEVFDTDILVLAYNTLTNYNLAMNAKKYGVKEVISYIETRDPADTMEKELDEAGIDTINKFSMDVNVLRTAIESPSMLQVLSNGGNARIYEVTVTNARYAGLEIHKLPFIKDITISRIFRNRRAIAPHGDTRIQLNDHIIFSGERDVVEKLRKSLGRLNE
ncbi:monovalent cation:proton antiporter family protein [Ligilactobacillus sp. LYQ135]